MFTVLPFLFLNDRTKSLFTIWKVGSFKVSKYGFGTCIDTFDCHLLQLIVSLKADFNFSKSFALSWVDKFATGTQSFVTVIVNIVVFVSSYNAHFSDQVKIRLTSQLIKGTSRVLGKLLKYFNEIIISTFFVLPVAVTNVSFC